MSKRSTKSAVVETVSNVNVQLPAQRDPNVVAYRFCRVWASAGGRANRSMSELMLGGGAKQVLGVDGESSDQQKAAALLDVNRGLIHTQDKPSKYTSFLHLTEKGGIETIVLSKHGAARVSETFPF